jgi:uncharacterized glyoxalase superfamily protein PhnB
MPLQKVFWGNIYGIVLNKFGITWSIGGGKQTE